MSTTALTSITQGIAQDGKFGITFRQGKCRGGNMPLPVSRDLDCYTFKLAHDQCIWLQSTKHQSNTTDLDLQQAAALDARCTRRES